MQNLVSYAIGALVVVGLYPVYVGATKGLPAVKAKLSSWWNSAKNDLAKVKGDVAGLEARVGALEQKTVLAHATTSATAAPVAAAAPATTAAAAAPAAAAPAAAAPSAPAH